MFYRWVQLVVEQTPRSFNLRLNYYCPTSLRTKSMTLAVLIVWSVDACLTVPTISRIPPPPQSPNLPDSVLIQRFHLFINQTTIPPTNIYKTKSSQVHVHTLIP